MSDTIKKERSYKIPQTTEDKGINETHIKRHTFGSTEKILRRNRKIWTRLANKIRRRISKRIIDEQNS